MAILFDHIVFFVENLEQAVHDFRDKGFHVVYGGSHPMWGTYNALIYFEDVYIELIAIEKEEIFRQAAKVPYTLHESYEMNGRKNGFTRFAIRTDDVNLMAKSFENTSFDVIGPEPFSRITNNGELIQWELLHIGNELISTSIPFIIDWKLNDRDRINKLKERGIISTHSNYISTIKKITFFVKNLNNLSEFYDNIKIPYSLYRKSILVLFDNVAVEYVMNPNANDAIIEFSCIESIPSFVYTGTEFKFSTI